MDKDKMEKHRSTDYHYHLLRLKERHQNKNTTPIVEHVHMNHEINNMVLNMSREEIESLRNWANQVLSSA